MEIDDDTKIKIMTFLKYFLKLIQSHVTIRSGHLITKYDIRNQTFVKIGMFCSGVCSKADI